MLIDWRLHSHRCVPGTTLFASSGRSAMSRSVNFTDFHCILHRCLAYNDRTTRPTAPVVVLSFTLAHRHVASIEIRSMWWWSLFEVVLMLCRPRLVPLSSSSSSLSQNHSTYCILFHLTPIQFLVFNKYFLCSSLQYERVWWKEQATSNNIFEENIKISRQIEHRSEHVWRLWNQSERLTNKIDKNGDARPRIGLKSTVILVRNTRS